MVLFDRKMCPALQTFAISPANQHHCIHNHLISIRKRTKFDLCSTIITQVSLYAYVINPSDDAHCQKCASPEERITATKVNSTNNGAEKMDFCSLGGGHAIEYNGRGLVETSKAFT